MRGPGRSITKDGYVRVRRPGHPLAVHKPWVYEHRAVAFDAGMLDGPDDHRHVHHKNHDKTDNRLENLEVLTASAHGAEHRTFDVDRAVSLYLAGASTIAVGREIGVDPSAISRVLAKVGIPARKGAPNKVDVDLSVVLPRLRAGEAPGWVARDIGVGEAVIRRVGREHGIPGRRAGRPTNAELAA